MKKKREMVMECPLKLAERSYGKLTKEHLKEITKVIGLTYYGDYYPNDYIAYADWLFHYLLNTCKCLENTTDKTDKMALACITNILITIGLSRDDVEFFLEHSRDYTCKKTSDEINEIWALAQNMSYGLICQFCCGKEFPIEINLGKKNYESCSKKCTNEI